MKKVLLALVLIIFFSLGILYALSIIKPDEDPELVKAIDMHPTNLDYVTNYLTNSFYGPVPFPDEIIGATSDIKLSYYCAPNAKHIIYNTKTQSVTVNNSDTSQPLQGAQIIGLLKQTDLANYAERIEGYLTECEIKDQPEHFGYIQVVSKDRSQKFIITFFHSNGEKLQPNGTFTEYTSGTCGYPLIATTDGVFYVQCFDSNHNKASLLKASLTTESVEKILDCSRQSGSKVTCTNGQNYE